MKSIMNRKFLAYLELAFAQFCIGANIVLGKILIDNFPIYSLLFIRFVIGFVLTGLYIIFTQYQQTKEDYQKLNFKDWIIVFLQALCGGFLFNVLVLYGLQYTTATVTGIINSAIPAVVALFSFFLLRERLNFSKMIAILLCVIGISVLSFGKSEGFAESQTRNDLFGISLILLSILPEAMFTIFAKLLKKTISPMATTLLINLFNALLFLPFMLGEDWSGMIGDASVFDFMHSSTGFQLLTYGLSGGILFFFFWYRGLKHVSANTAALFMGVFPISTTLLAFLFLQETLNLWDSIGIVCVMVSIFVGTLQRKPVPLYP